MKLPRSASPLLLALWLLSPASSLQEIANEPAGSAHLQLLNVNPAGCKPVSQPLLWF